MGLTFSDHFQPGSNTALPTTLPPMFSTSALPLPSKGRVSSGESKFLTSPAIGVLLSSSALPTRTYPVPALRASASGDRFPLPVPLLGDRALGGRAHAAGVL